MADTPHQLDHKVINSRAAALPSLIETLTGELYEGLLVFDGSKKVIFANQVAELLLGSTGEELLNLTLSALFPGEQVDLVYDSPGHSHRFQCELRSAAGKTLPAMVHLTTLPLKIQTLLVASIVAIPRGDEWTEKLIHSERLAGLGTMSASIAHELINPISVIGTTASNLMEIIGEMEAPDEELVRHLKMIETSVGRCYQLIDSLRAYTHGETLREKTRINDLIEHAVTLLEAQIEKKDNLRLKFELNPELPEVSCDPGQITQVLINLMLNARDAMPDGGGEIQLKTWAIPELGSIAVSVQDSGSGLPGEQIPKLFDPFYTTKRRGKGTGLGLFIVSEIVKQHNGWIRAQNRVEDDQTVSGAQITVMLPI